MKHFLIGFLALTFLFPLCPKTVDVASAQEMNQTMKHQVARTADHALNPAGGHSHGQDEHMCCAVHGGSDATSRVSSQGILSKDDRSFQSTLPFATLSLHVDVPILVNQEEFVGGSDPSFQTNDFERRSEVIRR